MLQAGASRPPALGHLGHLGHGFKLQAGASMHMSLGHLGHLFFGDPNDPKAQIWRPGNSPALGHLGHFVTLQKSARVESSTWRYTVYIYSI
jgi:hypothetical protein